ncbi:MAG: hypothetical protein J5492_05125, partial [Oxalobacter sp.]|nr:hypothetical protein [Oxalobacter sp.]
LAGSGNYAAVGFGLDIVDYDANAVAIIGDNAVDSTKEEREARDWLTEDEKKAAKDLAKEYRDDYEATVSSDVDQDIKDDIVDKDQRDVEIKRRLDVYEATTQAELEKEQLANKTTADKELEIDVKRTNAVKLAHEIAKEVAVHTRDAGKETEAKESSIDLTSTLGTKTAKGKQGTIQATDLAVSATTDGTINSIAIEGSYSADNQNWAKKYNQFMTRSKASSFMSDFLPGLVGVPINYLNKKLGGKIKEKLSPAAAAGGAGAAAGGAAPGGAMAANVDLHVSGAGSFAINNGDGMTFAMVDNTAIKAPDKGKLDKVHVSAEDSLFSGAWAGGAAINAHTGAGGGGGGGSREYTVGISLGYNSFDRDVSSIISNSTITEAGEVTDEAKKKGAEVGLGIGLAVSKGQGGGTEGSLGASVSYDRSASDIHALMVNDTVQGKDIQLSVNAYDQDIQVAGGVDFAWTSGGDDGVGAGGTATVSRIRNSLQSGLYGGTYTKMGDVSVEAVKSSLQVNVAVAGAVSTEESAKDAAFALAFGQVDNDSEAFIKHADVTSTGTVAVEANDTANESSYKEYLAKRGVDYEGASYVGEEGAKLVNGVKGGSKVVNIAVGFDKSGKGGGSVAGSINDLTEKMKVNVTGSTIHADRVLGQADSKTTIVDVAAGVAVGGSKFNGAGSFSWNDLETENTTVFANDWIYANKVSAIANNQANNVGIAGEFALGKGTAVGLSFAYNSFDSKTNALIQGGSIQAKNNGVLDVTVDAQNKSDMTAVAFGGSIATENSSALNGTLAINLGDNNTEAAIEEYKVKDEKSGEETAKGTKLADVKSIHVHATDDSTRRTGAGELTWTNNGKFGFGAAIGYSEIGGTSAQSGKEKENPAC